MSKLFATTILILIGLSTSGCVVDTVLHQLNLPGPTDIINVDK